MPPGATAIGWCLLLFSCLQPCGRGGALNLDRFTCAVEVAATSRHCALGTRLETRAVVKVVRVLALAALVVSSVALLEGKGKRKKERTARMSRCNPS